MTDHSLKGKTVLIAGGAKNLGGLIARDFASQGAKAIVIHYNSAATQADAEATVAAVQAAGSKAVALQGNLTSAAAMERLFADAVAAVGRPDIAINTVGKVLKKPLLEISEAEYDEMSAVNAKAAFSSSRRLAATSTTVAASAPWSPHCWVRSRRSIPAMPAPRHRLSISPARRPRSSVSAASR
ncbi:dehydrogenase [Stenotrophomonas maltophilia]|nr:dehydrogenase [Stenotrophomonas maltophilia]